MRELEKAYIKIIDNKIIFVNWEGRKIEKDNIYYIYELNKNEEEIINYYYLTEQIKEK